MKNPRINLLALVDLFKHDPIFNKKFITMAQVTMECGLSFFKGTLLLLSKFINSSPFTVFPNF